MAERGFLSIVAAGVTSSYTVWKALLWTGIMTGVTLRFLEVNLGVSGSSVLVSTCVYAGGGWLKLGGCPFSFKAATAGGRGRCPRGAVLCTMDCVEEVPDRELPDREEDSELGFISLALGASASSLHETWRRDPQCHPLHSHLKAPSPHQSTPDT